MPHNIKTAPEMGSVTNIELNNEKEYDEIKHKPIEGRKMQT